MAPLRGSYIVKLWKSGGRVLPRQELPPEAFWSVAELLELVEKLGDEWAVLFVALSYRWLSKANPDPDRHHLKVVGAVMEMYLSKDDEYKQPDFHLKRAGVEAEPDCVLFWGACALPRTD